jgi:putative flippase GtrA
VGVGEPSTRQSANRVLRYGLVGASASALYIGLTISIIDAAILPPLAASVAAFFLSLPAAYLGHLYLTFRRTEAERRQFLRFVLAMSHAFTVSTAMMWLTVDVLGAHYAYALAATTAVVTAFNYTVLNGWVFSVRAAQQERVGGSR